MDAGKSRIKEKYADVLKRIADLKLAFRGVAPSNETREGRLVYQLEWLEQTVKAGRLPIPLDKKYHATLSHLSADGFFASKPKVDRYVDELISVLDGTGLVKPRHYPLVKRKVDTLLAIVKAANKRTTQEQQLVQDLKRIRVGLEQASIRLPLEETKFPGWRHQTSYPNLDKLDGFTDSWYELWAILFHLHLPLECQVHLQPPKKGLRVE